MRILYHHRTQGKGVEGVHIMGVVNGLRKLGHEVKILCLPGTNPEECLARIATRESKSPYASISRLMPKLMFDVFSILYNLYPLLRWKRTVRPDMIFERYAFFAFMVTHLAQSRGIRTFLEVNNIIDQESVRSIKLKRIGRWMERKTLRKATHIFTVSRFLKKEIERLGVNKERITVLPNAIDEEIFNPEAVRPGPIAQSSGLEGRLVIGFTGLFVPWHGLNLLIEAFSQLSREHPDVRLLLVGDGPERENIETIVRRKHLKDRVVITGFVRHIDIPKYLAIMDIAVMPDSNPHGSPMKIFEYMAMETAVVAADYGPIAEVIENEVNGLLFPARSGDGMRWAMERLCGDQALRGRLAKKARTTVLEKHTWLRNAERILAVCDSLTRGKEI